MMRGDRADKARGYGRMMRNRGAGQGGRGVRDRRRSVGGRLAEKVIGFGGNGVGRRLVRLRFITTAAASSSSSSLAAAGAAGRGGSSYSGAVERRRIFLFAGHRGRRLGNDNGSRRRFLVFEKHFLVVGPKMEKRLDVGGRHCLGRKWGEGQRPTPRSGKHPCRAQPPIDLIRPIYRQENSQDKTNYKRRQDHKSHDNTRKVKTVMS